MTSRIVLIDDEPNLREVARIALSRAGFHIHAFGTGRDALEFIKKNHFDLCLVDLRLPDMSGIDVIQVIREQDPYVPIIIITAYASLETALEALRMHTTDYMIKPFEIDQLIYRVRRAIDEYHLFQENILLKRQLSRYEKSDDIILESDAMKRILKQVKQIAQTNHNVLITGESGVGKEVIARLIHRFSPRKNKPFVWINCAALPSQLLETELFGHVKGAFTGAISHKKGLFETAHGGTILLDEIGDMPYEMQAKLLRVLEDRKIRPIGATESIDIDVRVLAATNQNLEEKVEKGLFRQDLYYRLYVFRVHIPPLRERVEDIVPLAYCFLRKHCKELNKFIRDIAPETKRLLQSYSWPGNVRELENVIVRAILMEDHDMLHPHALLPEVLKASPIIISEHLPLFHDFPENFNLDTYIEELRAQLIERALQKTDGSRKKAAEILGIPLRSLKYYIGKYNLQKYRRSSSAPTSPSQSDKQASK